MRLKHLLSVFLTLLTLSVGQMWGTAATLPVNYTFGGDSYPTGVTGSGVTLQGYKSSHGNYRLKFDTNGDYIQIQVDAAAEVISVGIKKFGNSTTSLAIKGSSDGTTFTEIQTLSISGNQNTIQSASTTSSISSSYRYFRIERTAGENFGYGTLDITKAAVSCSNKVTVTKSSASNGSFTLKAGSASGTTINNSGTVDNCDADATIVVIPSANTHYHVSEVTATDKTNLTGPDASGNYTITYTKGSNINTTIGVTFEADPTYTVTWVAGSNSSFSNQTNYAGTALTDPGTPDVTLFCPGGKEFVGWTTTPIVGEQQNEPEDLFTSVSGKSIPIGGTTYYAVFADVDSDSEEQTLSFDASNFNLTSTYSVKTCTVDGYSFKVDKGYLNGTSNIQMNSSQGNGKLYNTTSIPGLKSVRLNVASGSNTKTVYSGSTSGSTTHNLGTTTSSSKTFDVEEGDTYFTILVSGANYLSSVVVTYEETSSVASNYATTCCTPLGSINGSFS